MRVQWKRNILKMATKDWKKVSTTEVAEWEKNKNLSLVVGSVGGGNYEVELKKYSPSTGVYRDVLKSSNSKPKAITYAKNYMRSH